MTTRVIASTAPEYAKGLGPHLAHETYRCDDPHRRLMGKGCRTCAVELVIAIADFQATGDLEAFERELAPHKPAKAKK